MPFNRNIITAADIAHLKSAKQQSEIPVTLDVAPPGGLSPLPVGGPQAPAASASTATAEDDYMTKLLKYVPAEVLGLYLLLGGVIDSNVPDGSAHGWWLGLLLIATLGLTVVYLRLVLNVRRTLQIAMSVVALVVYVFSLGGWFATMPWYQSWYASIAIPLFAFLVGAIKLQPLPQP